jgi:phage baseplate assembly protein V
MAGTLDPIARRVRLMVGRAVVKLVSDAGALQELQLQLLADEVRSRAERFQNYGFTSVPLPGAEAVAVSVGGSRSHVVVVAVDDRRYRLKDLQPGEVAIYTDQGDRIVLKRDGQIEVVASTRVRIECPRVECSGDLHVEGSVTCDQNVSDVNGSMQEMRDIYNSHTHGGVDPGAGNTAAPGQEMA